MATVLNVSARGQLATAKRNILSYPIINGTILSNRANATIASGTSDTPFTKQLLKSLDNTLLQDLTPDPENEIHFPNRISRAVNSGHWVHVQPQPLEKPFLVAHNASMTTELGLDDLDCNSDVFARLFSGDVSAMPELIPWATPSAVSAMGNPIMGLDPFQGNAYGDDRLVSLGEFITTDRWELQLKGSGTTPFSYSSDGREILRCSVRDFLASEAMHHLGVPTARSLCLIASQSEYVPRLWYDDNDTKAKHYYDPNTLKKERCAITCRAARSFLRIGQVELFARRMRQGSPGAKMELTALLKHALDREFPEIVGNSLDKKLLEMLRITAQRYARLSSEWLRVGYIQGNMNSDNFFLKGRTMVYGPFGFMEEYNPLWSPFTGDPKRQYGYERQPVAAQMNLATLADAVLPLLPKSEKCYRDIQKIINYDFPLALNHELIETRRRKLGLSHWDKGIFGALWNPLNRLMIGVDYTIFWRQLSKYTTDMLNFSDAALLELLEPSFYITVDNKQRDELCNWLRLWLAKLTMDDIDEATRISMMKTVSPKFVPRGWMLAEAYAGVEVGNYSIFNELVSLFKKPYDEHPEFEKKYYRRTPDSVSRKAGVMFYT